MAWHASYRDNVLAPDFRFATENLLHHFLDAMTAHLDRVAALPYVVGEGNAAALARLREDMVAAHDDVGPDQALEVPDLYFGLMARLESRHGPTVGAVRVGLSRNDLDMTVYKMHGRQLLLRLGRALVDLRSTVLALAGRHLDTVMVAKTHHMPGQPTTLAHYLAAVEAQLARDTRRLVQAYDAMNLCPLGAAALAGTSHAVDRAASAAALGFDGPVENTYDAVAASDWELDIVGVGQTAAIGLGRFVTDLVDMAATGVLVVPDDLTQGSSIMPQKRNPVALEHARTRLSRAVGAAAMVTVSSHNIPFTDLNDFGPDVQGALLLQSRQLAGAIELVRACLDGGRFDVGLLAEQARATDTTATELADVLVRSGGLRFPEAHALVREVLKRLAEDGRRMAELDPADLVAAGGPRLSTEELSGAVDAMAFVNGRSGLGMPAPAAMAGQLLGADARLAADRDDLDLRSERVRAAIERLRRPGGDA